MYKRDSMNDTFLIVDVQKEYVENPLFKDQLKSAAMYINEVSKYFRDASECWFESYTKIILSKGEHRFKYSNGLNRL